MMTRLRLTTAQKKRASTKLALAVSELEAAEVLSTESLLRECLVHLYFASFYASQALLAGELGSNPTHKQVEVSLHKKFGRSRTFPRTYVKLHSDLHRLRTEYNYRTVLSPHPKQVGSLLRSTGAFIRRALRDVPRVELDEIIRDLARAYPKQILDLSFDFYCPQTYRHHTRTTLWLPPVYFGDLTSTRIANVLRGGLRQLRVARTEDYVLGLNSRLDQYGGPHLLMLDIDGFDPSVEDALKILKGTLLKTSRGFHFIGSELIPTQREWEMKMRQVRNRKPLRGYVDRKHIDISLERGYATLRITDSPVKNQVPFFFKEW